MRDPDPRPSADFSNQAKQFVVTRSGNPTSEARNHLSCKPGSFWEIALRPIGERDWLWPKLFEMQQRMESMQRLKVLMPYISSDKFINSLS